MEIQNVKTVRLQDCKTVRPISGFVFSTETAPFGSPEGGKTQSFTERHCERSEAIQSDGIAGQARNDGVASFLYQTLTSFTMTVFVLFLFLLLLPSCTPPLPPDIWEKEQMTEFLIEAQLIEAKVDAKELPKKQKDSLYACFYEELFASYNTTREIWQKNIQYYRDKPEEMDEIYKEVVSRLTLMESRVQHERSERDTLGRRDSLRLKDFKIR